MSTNGNAIRADELTGTRLLGSYKKVAAGQRLQESVAWARSVHFFRSPRHQKICLWRRRRRQEEAGRVKHLTK